MCLSHCGIYSVVFRGGRSMINIKIKHKCQTSKISSSNLEPMRHICNYLPWVILDTCEQGADAAGHIQVASQSEELSDIMLLSTDVGHFIAGY